MTPKLMPALSLVYRGLVAASLLTINGCAAPRWMGELFQGGSKQAASALLPHQMQSARYARETTDPSVLQITDATAAFPVAINPSLPHNTVAEVLPVQPQNILPDIQTTGIRLKTDVEFVSAKRIVFMAYAKTTLGPAGKRAAAEMVPYAKQAEKVNVRGFSDSTGDYSKNLGLARARAEHLAAVFVQAGVPKAKVQKDGYVRDTQAAALPDSQGKSMRGVEVTLVLPTVVAKELPTDVYAMAPMNLKSASTLNVAMLAK